MIKRIVVTAALVSLLLCLAYLYSLESSNDRNWYDYYQNTPDATVSEDGKVTLRYLRDFKHDRSGTAQDEWQENVTIDPEDVSRVWFVLSAIEESKYVAHSFLVFELNDGRAISFSIEARREEGEPYSALLGLFRKYDLIYSWGMERDFVGVRLFVFDYQTEMYPLLLDEEQAGKVFVAMARATADMADNPRFYNTLTGNCTNLLAKAINEAVPGRLPYDLSWNLPALSVGYLIEQGFIDSKGADIDAVRANAVINDFTDELMSVNDSALDFSRTLRRLYFEKMGE
jgi:hypothetical protein